jgi:hypothetical protein
MCDIINNDININKNNLLFNKEHFIYIKNFINYDIRLHLFSFKTPIFICQFYKI